jgi:hypothetical protein
MKVCMLLLMMMTTTTVVVMMMLKPSLNDGDGNAVWWFDRE